MCIIYCLYMYMYMYMYYLQISSNWSDVVQLCRKAHYQPLLLVYTNPFAEKITMTTAPTKVTKVADHKPKPLSPVTETENGSNPSTPSEQPQAKTDPPSVGLASPAKGSVPASNSSSTAATGTQSVSVGIASTNSGTTATCSTKPTSTNAQTHTSTKPGVDPAYEIDPNTLSIRPVTLGAGHTSHPLPPAKRGEQRGTTNPLPSAPPLLPVPQKSTARVSPVTQSPVGKLKPVTTHSHPSPSFPALFQATPTAPPPQTSSPRHHSNAVPLTLHSSYPQTANRPPYHQSFPPTQPVPPSLSSNHPYHQRTNYPTNAIPASSATATGSAGYPPPTYPTRLPAHSSSQTNAGYGYSTASTYDQSSPYRGSNTARNLLSTFGRVLQPNTSQLPPQTALFQSNSQPGPSSSSSASQKLPSQLRATGYASLPGSPAKTATHHQQRASSIQPGATCTNSPSRLSSIARPRPSPPRSVPPPPPQEDKTASPQSSPHSTSTDSTLGGSTDNLIQFSLSPALLTHSKTNQDQSRQGCTSLPLHPSPDSSSVLSSSMYSSSSREVSPHRLENESSTASLEDDLIQWSLTPDMIQKVQRYRSRQEIRQSSTDSLNLSGRTAATPVTGNSVRETRTASGHSAVISSDPVENKSSVERKKLRVISERVCPAGVQSNSAGSSVLVDISDLTQTAGSNSEEERLGVGQEWAE